MTTGQVNDAWWNLSLARDFVRAFTSARLSRTGASTHVPLAVLARANSAFANYYTALCFYETYDALAVVQYMVEACVAMRDFGDALREGSL
jgi:hypothetical protein